MNRGVLKMFSLELSKPDKVKILTEDFVLRQKAELTVSTNDFRLGDV